MLGIGHPLRIAPVRGRIAGELDGIALQGAIDGVVAFVADGADVAAAHVLQDHALEQVVDILDAEGEVDAGLALDLAFTLEVADAAGIKDDLGNGQLRLCHLAVAGRRFRARFRREWEAELEYREELLARWDRLDWRNKLELLWRSLGAFWDAMWLQRQRWEDEMIQDLRFGFRMLLKNPGFTMIAALTLALGIGANTAIFSVVNAVLLRPLPYADPERLVVLWERERNVGQESPSYPNFLDWRERNQTFAAMAATSGVNASVGTPGQIEVVRGSAVTVDFLTVLGASPLIGRNFLPEEDRPGSNARVVILTHGAWQRRFGGDPDVVGKTLTINENAFTVVGVLPESFGWGTGSNFELLMPLAPDPQRSRGDHRLLVIGKLKEGVSREQGFADLNTIAAQLADQFPESNKGWSVSGESFYDWIVPEEIRRSLLSTRTVARRLELERRLEAIKLETEVGLLRAQASHARREGRVEVAESLEASILLLLAPPPAGVPRQSR